MSTKTYRLWFLLLLLLLRVAWLSLDSRLGGD